MLTVHSCANTQRNECWLLFEGNTFQSFLDHFKGQCSTDSCMQSLARVVVYKSYVLHTGVLPAPIASVFPNSNSHVGHVCLCQNRFCVNVSAWDWSLLLFESHEDFFSLSPLCGNANTLTHSRFAPWYSKSPGVCEGGQEHSVTCTDSLE